MLNNKNIIEYIAFLFAIFLVILAIFCIDIAIRMKNINSLI